MRMIGLAMIMFAAACGGGGNNSDGNTDPDAPVNPQPDGDDPDGPPMMGKRTVFTIVLENHDYDEIVGSSNAPYINSLIGMGALATNYNDTIHPSLGNYLHMISGENQYPGFIDVGPKQAPYFPADKQHLGSQLIAANIPWRAYMESMGTACRLTDNGPYAPKHNPFVYFKDYQGTPACMQTNVDFSNLDADLASNMYRFMWITPNLNSDGHDPSGDPALAMRNSDTWLSQQVPKILASEGFTSGGVLLITWDEAEDRTASGADKIPMIVLSPRVKQAGMQLGTMMDHGSYLATVEELLGLPKLPTVASAPTLMSVLNP